MDQGWADLQHDLTLDLREMEHGQFVIMQHYAGLDPDPYVQAAPDAAGGWYCELVSERYLPATEWPIDSWYLMAAGWTPPTDPRDNWSRPADSPSHAAQLLADGLRHGRQCRDWRPVTWRTACFPRPPEDGPNEPPHPPTPGQTGALAARHSTPRSEPPVTSGHPAEWGRTHWFGNCIGLRSTASRHHRVAAGRTAPPRECTECSSNR